MSKVFLGVGHGGNDSGAIGNGLKEKDLTLSIAKCCREELERHGVQVLMSRYADENDPIQEEVRECNNFNPDVAADIHINAGGGDGFEVYYYSKGGTSKELATSIEKEVIAIGQNSRGLKTRLGDDGRDYYMFIRETNPPAIIVECAFIDNSADIQIIDTLEEQKRMGIAIAHGILKQLGISIKGQNTAPTAYKTEPQYYIETSYINPDAYVNGILRFFDSKDIKIQLKGDAEGAFLQTMHLELERCKALAYTFTSQFDIMAYVWREDKITDQNGNISYSSRVLV